MSKTVLLSSRAQKNYKDLPKDIRKRVRAALKKLGAGDKDLDIKKIRGVSGREDLYRLRVGEYRITYKPEKQVIKVARIDPRSKKYRWLN